MTSPEPQVGSRELHVEVNERTAAVTRQLADADVDTVVRVLCECGKLGCLTQLEITLSEYEAARAAPDRWVVSSGHIDQLASVVAQRDGYALIHAPPPSEA